MKKVLLGTNSGIVYVITNCEDGTISYDQYDKVYDDDDGEERARDYLEGDTYLWKSAVENDNTTQGLDDWNDEVIKYDGWRHVLGEDNIIDIDDRGFYFCDDNDHSEGDGLPVSFDELDQTDISEEDFELLEKALENDDTKGVNEFFTKYLEFDVEELKRFV